MKLVYPSRGINKNEVYFILFYLCSQYEEKLQRLVQEIFPFFANWIFLHFLNFRFVGLFLTCT